MGLSRLARPALTALLITLLLTGVALSASATDAGPVAAATTYVGIVPTDESAPNITLRYPADGGAVPGGKQVSVMWYSNNTTSGSVKVEVAEDGSTWKTLAQGQKTNGSAPWNVTWGNFSGAKVRVTANTTSGPVNATANNVYIDSKLPESRIRGMGGERACIDVERPLQPDHLIAYIPFDAWDNGSSGVAYVELWWRIEHRGAVYEPDPASQTAVSPMKFEVKKEGTYEFYTIAVDRAGNREPEKFGNDTSVTLDGEIPEISLSSVFPGNNTQIPFWPSLKLGFTEKMNYSDTTKITITPGGPKIINPAWNELHDTLTVALDQPLIPGAEYNITITDQLDKCAKRMWPAWLNYIVADPPLPSQGNISGQVVHAFTQEPVPNALVEATYNRTTSKIRSATADSGGFFDLEGIPPTTYMLEYSAAGFKNGSLVTTINPDDWPFMKLDLIPEGELAAWMRGTVSGTDKKPLAGAELESSAGSKATTDANGKYLLALRPGKNTVKVQKDGIVVALEVDVAVGQTITKNILLAPTVLRTNLVPGVALIIVFVVVGLLVIVAAARRKSRVRKAHRSDGAAYAPTGATTSAPDTAAATSSPPTPTGSAPTEPAPPPSADLPPPPS